MPTLSIVICGNYNPHIHVFSCLCGIVFSTNNHNKEYLQKGFDGAVHMFYNGIFNSPDDAAGNAVQMAVNKNGHLYFTYFPQAEDWEVELGIAFYQKFWEGDTLGLSNSTKKFQDFLSRYGNDKAIVSAHSRGSLTGSNGLRDLKNRGIHSIGEKTDIYLFGPADYALSIANVHYYVNGGKKDHIYLQNHILDPIGTVIGHTAYKVPLKFPYVLFPQAIPMIEQVGALRSHNPSTTHKCYGDASDACKHDYGTPHDAIIYAPHAILDNLGLGYLWRKNEYTV
ncbi:MULTISPECIES: hypothetical protein [Bartonella]|uniref:hypothetical protein n=1 Tax=Bartonella TaxID=773 RepID=UPI0023630DAB|nr:MULTISPECIES: hypothetical protein [Bartonella]